MICLLDSTSTELESSTNDNQQRQTTSMSEYYSLYGDDGSFGYNTTSDQDGKPATTVECVQAVFAFCLGLSVYFCMLCNIWLKDGSVTKKEVERSIVRKRVVAHGQSHCFDFDHVQDDEGVEKHSCCGKIANSCQCRSVAQYCCRRKCSRAIHPTPIDDVKNSNRPDPTTSQTECANNTAGVDDAEQGQACISDFDQAEQGLVTVALDEEITCPICLEPMKVGEEVAWSKLRRCLHVYHYECITRWLFDGNMYCPVCREYWKRNYRECDRENCCTKLVYGRQTDLGGNMDTRRYQFCEVHGLTLPPGDLDQAEAATSCTNSGNALEV